MANLALVQPAPAKRRIVMVFGPKGGVGKTMISAHMLVSAAMKGYRAVGVDFDPQRSLSIWYEGRMANPGAVSERGRTPFDVADADISDWMNVLDHAEDYDLVILDMPPGFKHNETDVFSLSSNADLILIPCGCSGGDSPIVAPWMTRFRDRGLNAKFCLTMYNLPSDIDFRRTELHLSDKGPILGRIPRRAELSHAWCQGLTAFDQKASGTGTAPDFTTLFNQVQQEINL